MSQQRSSPFKKHVEAGREAASMGYAHKAATEWTEALKLNPRSVMVWELLGELNTSIGNWPGGVQAFRQLASLEPKKPDVHGRLAVCLLRSGVEREAFNEASEELKRNPNDISSLLICALLTSKMGDRDQEVAFEERILKKDPDNIFVLRLLAENYTYVHNYAAALPLIERILRLDPGNSEAYSLRGMATYNEDRSADGLKRAEADFIQSLKNNPLAPFARLYVGKIYRARGELDKALFQLETAQRLMPNKMDINFELAGALEQAGKSEQAAVFRKRFETIRDRMTLKSSLQKKCSVDPNNFEIHLQLGTLYMNEGDYSLARPYLEQAKMLRPTDPRAIKAVEQLSMRMESEADPRDALLGSLRSSAAGAKRTSASAPSGGGP